MNEKYYKWGKGLKQVEDAAERAAETLKEMSKPLARYVNDTDLDNFLKAQEREGDPMLDYIKRKQSEATPLAGVKPIYQGSFNPNRFGIRPGHRWDGVVRSNGYEKEWFSHQNARKAKAEEAYKWSTSDM
ncbi:BUD13 homolog [Homalodisca vitripennis]|nr:BUD13 homolog [Homalodisca vitripennis]